MTAAPPPHPSLLQKDDRQKEEERGGGTPRVQFTAPGRKRRPTQLGKMKKVVAAVVVDVAVAGRPC